MKSKYIRFEVFEAPRNPKENGKTIGTVQLLDQAEEAVQIAHRQGKVYGIRAIKADGSKVWLL